MQKLYYILIVALTTLVTSCFHTSGKDEDATAIPDTLKVAVELSSMTLNTAGDTISGFSFEVLQRISGEHNLPLKVTAFNNIEEALAENNRAMFDIFVSNIPITSDLREHYLVTTPLFTDRQVLVQNIETQTDSIITTPAQLDCRPVWVPQRSAIIDRMENLASETGTDIIIIPVDDITEEQLVILVSLGEIPRGVASESTALALIDQYPQLNIDTKLSFNQFRSWILNPADTVLRDSLDSWITDFKDTPEYVTLEKKYKIRNP